VLGLKTKFLLVLLTTRMRSIVGLKSNPNEVPSIVVADPTAVSAAVLVFTV